jgi:hypothetical protein
MFGLPHGFCFLEYVHDGVKDNDFRSFTGVSFTRKGQLHRGPATFETGDGQKLAFSRMNYGRPEGFARYYRPENF